MLYFNYSLAAELGIVSANHPRKMTADLEKHLTQRGLQMISPEQGPKLLLDELAFGRKGETEVIIARATEDAGG